MKNSIIEELENGYSVQSGVFAAVNSKITTKLNEYGQYEADIDTSKLSDKELEVLAAVSAMSNSKLNESALSKKLFGKTKEVKHNDLLGYYTDLYAGHVVTGGYRANASSGGLGSWLLVQLLERKLIDGVIHVVPSDPKKDGVLFKYEISKTIKAINAGSKSRYYPADLSEVLRTVKKSGGKYAITGIPSFITELRLLAEHDVAFKKSIAFTIGLVCGHQKSATYVEALAWQHGIKPGNLMSADFRKKVEGESSNRYISEFTGLIDGKKQTIIKDQDELFVSNWAHGMFKSKLSDYTDDTFNETADISLGDAWLPEYTKDSKGTNIAIVRNTTIAKIIRDGIKSGDLHLDTLPPEQIIKSQSGLAHHTRDELPYRLHKQQRAGNWHPVKRFAPSPNLPLLRKKVQDIRETIATESHVHYLEAKRRDDWNYFEQKMRPHMRNYRAIYFVMYIKNKGPVFIIKKVKEKLLR